MRRRIRFHAEFRADVQQHLEGLVERGDPSWIERLRADVDEAVELLVRFPDIGTIEAEHDKRVLRRIILRKTPYVLWFTRDTAEEAGDVWFVRLFHARQERPAAVTALRARRKSARKKA